LTLPYTAYHLSYHRCGHPAVHLFTVAGGYPAYPVADQPETGSRLLHRGAREKYVAQKTQDSRWKGWPNRPFEPFHHGKLSQWTVLHLFWDEKKLHALQGTRLPFMSLQP